MIDEGLKFANEGVNKFNSKKYSEALEKFENALKNLTDAKVNLEKIEKNDKLIDLINRNVPKINLNIISCKVALVLELTNKAKELFENGEYESALSNYKEALNQFKEIQKEIKERKIENLEIIDNLNKYIKITESNIESCEQAIDKRFVENTCEEIQLLHNEAIKLAESGELLKAHDKLSIAESKVKEAFKISTQRNFRDAIKRLEKLLELIRKEISFIEKAMADGVRTVVLQPIIPEQIITTEPVIDIPSILEYTPVSYAISAGWTIYDPAEQKFIFTPKCEKPIKEWINKYDPFSYWIAVCITNESEEPITSFELEFETSNLLEVKSVYVEGRDKPIRFEKERTNRIGRIKYIISIPEEYGISIPRGGSKRIYINIYTDHCGQRYFIESGIVRTENSIVKLSDLDFFYSCQLLNIKEEPELIKTKEGQELIENTFKEKFGINWKKVLEITNGIFRLIDSKELRAIKYVDAVKILKDVSNDKVIQEFYRDLVIRMKKVFAESKTLTKTFDQLLKNPDYNEVLCEEDLHKILSCLIDTIYNLTTKK